MMDNIREAFVALDVDIARFLGDIYDFMVDFASFKFLDMPEVDLIKTKIYGIVAIIMLFRIALSLLAYVTNPDDSTNEKSKNYQGKLPGRAMMLIVFLVGLPFAFDYSKDLEQAILNEGVLEGILPGLVTAEMAEKAEEQYAGTVDYVICSYKLLGESDKHALTNGKVLDTFQYSTKEDTAKMNANSKYASTGTLNNGEFDDFTTKFVTYLDDRDNTEEAAVCCPYIAIDLVEFGQKTITAHCDDRIRTAFYSNYELVGKEDQSFKSTPGTRFASNLLTIFIYPNPDIYDTTPNVNYYVEYEEGKNTGKLAMIEAVAMEKTDNDTYYFIHRTAISVVTMIVVAGILISSLVDLALRMVKLFFLELVAPIALVGLMNIDERNVDTTFHKWGKEYLTTFADIFIKIGTIQIGVYFLGLLLAQLDVVEATQTASAGVWKLLIIIGVLMFIKNIGNILNTVFGVPLGSGLTINPLKKAQEIPGIGTAVGAATGLLGGAAVGLMKGGLPGMALGGLQGASKGIENTPIGGAEPGKGAGMKDIWGAAGTAISSASTKGGTPDQNFATRWAANATKDRTDSKGATSYDILTTQKYPDPGGSGNSYSQKDYIDANKQVQQADKEIEKFTQMRDQAIVDGDTAAAGRATGQITTWSGIKSSAEGNRNDASFANDIANKDKQRYSSKTGYQEK